MKISVIMIDGGFRERAYGAEYFSKQKFPADEYEILWVEFYDKVHPDLHKYPRVKVIALNNKGIYHSSYCFNAGIRDAKGEILVIPDADIMVGEDFLSTVYQEHDRNHELVMYFHRFCQPEHLVKGEDSSFDYIRRTSRIPEFGIENYGGCLSVRKRWLLEIDGYEQHRAFATGNHANGRDVYTRLKNLGLNIKWHPRQYLYHPWHYGSSGMNADKRRVTWQREIIKYRAVRLMTTAFEGLNANYNTNHEVPPPPQGDPDIKKHRRKPKRP